MKRVWTLASPGCTIALSSPATRSLGFSGGDEENPHCRVKTLHWQTSIRGVSVLGTFKELNFRQGKNPDKELTEENNLNKENL